MDKYFNKFGSTIEAYENWDKHVSSFGIGKYMNNDFLTGSPGKLVDLESTIKGFDAICKGEYDHLPEAAFYMVGGIEEAVEKAEKLSKDNK